MSMDRQRLWLGAGLVLLLALAYHFVGLAVVPPGLDRDAAANGWQALKWLRTGIVPFWMPHASAPEPLIVWLQTATTAMLGPSVLALRSASAIFLALAALVVYWLTLAVAKPFPLAQRWWAAILAGIVFACNPVVTQLARTGLRATTLPLLSGLFFLCLLRAWRTNARRDYFVSGAVLGLAAYTYLAARFLPIVVLIFVAIALWIEYRDRHSERSEESRPAAEGDSSSQTPRNDVVAFDQGRQSKDRLIGLVLMGIAALIVVLPQLIFFYTYPTAFWERAQSVSLLNNPAYSEIGLAKLLLDKVAAMALIFGVEWSGQYNQAARPLLSPLPFVGLLLSLPLVWHWRRQAAMLLTIVAFLIMLLPDLIGGDRVMPHELRVIGTFVPTMVLSGIGVAYGLGWIMRFGGGKVAWHVGGALLAVLITSWSIYDWFGMAAPALAKSDYEWFARPDVAFADAVNIHDAPLLVPLNDYSRSVIAYLTAKGIEQLGSGIGADGQIVQPSSDRVLLLWPAVPERPRVESVSYRFDPQSLVLLDGGRAYLMPPAGADVAQLQSECVAQPFTTPTGEAAGALCEVDFAQFDFPTQLPAPLWSVGNLYDGNLRLHGISADTITLTAGTTLGITSFWQAQPRIRERWRYFVHLLDDRQQLVAGDDLIPGYGVYDTQLWQPDEIVPIRQAVQLPDNLPAGRYWIEVGLYDPLSGERALVSETGADRILVGPLKAPLQESAELADAIELKAQFGDEIALEGYQLARSDGELQVTLRLAALRQPERDYTLFVHVENASGEIVAQSDAQPRDGQYPTAIWEAGEEVLSTWRVALPPMLEAGSYRLWLGLYNGQDGARLPVAAAGATIDGDRLLLSEIELP